LLELNYSVLSSFIIGCLENCDDDDDMLTPLYTMSLVRPKLFGLSPKVYPKKFDQLP